MNKHEERSNDFVFPEHLQDIPDRCSSLNFFRINDASPRRRSRTKRAGSLLIDRLKRDFDRVRELVTCAKPRENWRAGFLARYFSVGRCECVGEGTTKCERGSRKSLIPERPKALSIGLRSSGGTLEDDHANEDLNVDVLAKSFKQFFSDVGRSSIEAACDHSKSENLKLQGRLGSRRWYEEDSRRRYYDKGVRSELQHSKVIELDRKANLESFGNTERASSTKNSDVDHFPERDHWQTNVSRRLNKDAEVQTSRRKKSESRELNVADDFFVGKSHRRTKQPREFASVGKTRSKEIKTIFKSDVSNIKAKHEGCEPDANSRKIMRPRRKEKHDGRLAVQNDTNNASYESPLENCDMVFCKKYRKKNIEILRFNDAPETPAEEQKSNVTLKSTMKKYSKKYYQRRDDGEFRTANFKESARAPLAHGKTEISTESIAGPMEGSIKMSRKVSTGTDKISDCSLCLKDSMEYFDALEDPLDSETRLTESIDTSEMGNSKGISKDSAVYYRNANNSMRLKSGAKSGNLRSSEQRVSCRNYEPVESRCEKPKRLANLPRENRDLDSKVSELTILENVKRRLEMDFDDSPITMDDSMEEGFFSISEDSVNFSSVDQSSSNTKSDCFPSDVNKYVSPIVTPNTKYNNMNVDAYTSSRDDIRISESETGSRNFSETDRVNRPFDNAKNDSKFSSFDDTTSVPFTSSVAEYTYLIVHPLSSTLQNSEVLKLRRHCRNTSKIPRINHSFTKVQNNCGFRNTWTSVPFTPSISKDSNLNVVTCNSASSPVQIEEQDAHRCNLSKIKRLNQFPDVKTNRECSTVKKSMYAASVSPVPKYKKLSVNTNLILADIQIGRSAEISDKTGEISCSSVNAENNFTSTAATPCTKHYNRNTVIRNSISSNVLVQESRTYSENVSKTWWTNQPVNNAKVVHHTPSISGDSIPTSMPASAKQPNMRVNTQDTIFPDIITQGTRIHPQNVNKMKNNMSYNTDDSISPSIGFKSRSSASLQTNIHHPTPSNIEIQDSGMYSTSLSKTENMGLPSVNIETNYLPYNVGNLIFLPVKGECRKSRSIKRDSHHSGSSNITIQESRTSSVNLCKIQRKTRSFANDNSVDPSCIIENSISLPTLSPATNANLGANIRDSISNNITINSTASRYVSCFSFSCLDSMRSLYSYRNSLEERLMSDESTTYSSLECSASSRNKFSEFSSLSSSSVDQSSPSIPETMSNNTLDEQEYPENNEGTAISSLEYSSYSKDNISKSNALPTSFADQNTSSSTACSYYRMFEEEEYLENKETSNIPSLEYVCSSTNNAPSKFNFSSDSPTDRSSPNVFEDTHGYALGTLNKGVDLWKDNSPGDSGVFQDSDFDDSQIANQRMTCNYVQRSTPVFSKSPNRVIESIDSGILTDYSPIKVPTSESAEGKVPTEDNERRLGYPSMGFDLLRKTICINTDSSSSDDSLDRRVDRAVEIFTENLILCERKAKMKLERLECVKKHNKMEEQRRNRRQNRKTSMRIRRRSESLGSSCIFESPRWSSEDERIFSVSTPSLVSLSDSENEIT